MPCRPLLLIEGPFMLFTADWSNLDAPESSRYDSQHLQLRIFEVFFWTSSSRDSSMTISQQVSRLVGSFLRVALVPLILIGIPSWPMLGLLCIGEPECS